MTWLLGDVSLLWLKLHSWWWHERFTFMYFHRKQNLLIFSLTIQRNYNTNTAGMVALVHLFRVQRNIFNSAQGSRSWPCRNLFHFRHMLLDVSVPVLSYKCSSNRFSSRTSFKSLYPALFSFKLGNLIWMQMCEQWARGNAPLKYQYLLHLFKPLGWYNVGYFKTRPCHLFEL